MPIRKDKGFVTFNSGECNFLAVKNREVISTRFSGIRYGEHVTGIKKYFDAKVLSSQIDRTIVIPPISISQQDICQIEGNQYKIVLIQNKYDQNPPHYVLSLQNVVPLYKDVRNNG